MRKIKKGQAPNIIKTKNAEFLKEFSKNPDINIQRKWDAWSKKKELREYLAGIQFEKCCYCERGIILTTEQEIEHFKPKNIYKKLCFDYKNLFLACPSCNRAKLERDDNIINPSTTDPFKHIYFSGEKVLHINKSKKGKNTIEVLKMNESDRIKARSNYLEKVIGRQLGLYLDKIKRGEIEIENDLDELFSEKAIYRKLCLDNYGESYKKMKKEIERIKSSYK
jgi:uncharacterized protein (TIGR02646 family)